MPEKNKNENNNNQTPQEKKEPVAVIVRNREIVKQLEMLKGATEIGVRTAEKGIVIFYDRTTRIGEIIKQILFILFGLSILLAGLFATPADLLTAWNLVSKAKGLLWGRALIVIAGGSLVAAGVSSIWSLVKLTHFLEHKQKFRQKKLIE